MLSKTQVVDTLIAALQTELTAADHASRDAAAYATDEESRAESQWDTQGLEASYLAAGQASHARDIANALHRIQGNRRELEHARENVTTGALVECRLGHGCEWFFFAPVGGGEALNVAGTEVTVITPDSPLAHALVGHRAGDDFTLPNGSAGSVVTVK